MAAERPNVKEYQQKAAENEQQQVSQDIAAKPLAQWGQDIAKTVPTQPPSVQQDIDQVLSSYMNQLFQLGPDYAKEMAFMAPYLTGEQSTGLAPAAPYTGPDAAVVNANDAKLAAADKTMAQAAEGEQKMGFGQAASETKAYENSLMYQQPLAAALNYQRYIESYQGAKPNIGSWNPQVAAAYQALTSTSGGAAGSPSLPAPTTAAIGAGTNQGPTLTPTVAPSGSASPFG